MSDHSKDDDYDVGYGKPPQSTQFKKGRSGNPKGRPREARGVRASLKRELESKITVREGNREVRMSKAQALAKRLAASALKGDPRALMALLKLDVELFGSTGSDPGIDAFATNPEPVDYDILRDFFSEPSAAEGETVEDKEIDGDEA